MKALGHDANTVSMTSDRHWTWVCAARDEITE